MPDTTRPLWHIALLVVVLIGQFVYRADHSQKRKSPVWDETIHIDYGAAFLRRGPKIAAKDHPYPVAAFMALPIVLGERPELDSRGNIEISAPSNLWPARRMNIALSVAGLCLMATLVMQLFGGPVALCFLLLGTVDPGWIAQARFATTDIAHGLGFALSAFFVFHYQKTGRNSSLVGAGLATALALLSKFSGLLLFPLVMVILLLGRQKALKSFALYCAAALGFVLLIFEAHALFGAASFWDGPNHLWTGFQEFLTIRALPKGIFVWGDYVQGGSFLYLPLLIVSKTPVLLMGLLLSALFLPAVRTLAREHRRLFVIPAAFLLVAFASRINSGLRHMAPVLPFLWLLAAWVLMELKSRFKRGSAVAAAIVLLLLLEVLPAHPHYLPFTNALFGGTDNAHKIAANAASDWGQDLAEFAFYLKANPPETPIHLAYFGRTQPIRYGIQDVICRPCGALGRHCDRKQPQAPCEQPAKFLAISATCLQGDARRLDGKIGQDTCYQWLQNRPPDAIVGGSILIFKNAQP